jgi:hypothetical protein
VRREGNAPGVCGRCCCSVGSRREVNAWEAYVVSRECRSTYDVVPVAGEAGVVDALEIRSRNIVVYCVMISYTPSRHMSMYFFKNRATSSASLPSLRAPPFPSPPGPTTP